MDNNNIVAAAADIPGRFDLSHRTMTDDLSGVEKVRETFEKPQIENDLIMSLKARIDSSVNKPDQLQTTTTIAEAVPDELDANNEIQDPIDNSIESELFLSLKLHIDSQNRLNQLNQSRIRSFERFRKYCQTVTSSSPSEQTKFDPEQFRNEYNKFDRNYRYWRKRVRKLRKETKCSMSTRFQNPYDTLSELFAKIESSERSKNNLNDTKKYNSTRSTQDQSIQCDFKDFIDGRQARITTKRPRGATRNKSTRSQYLSADPIYPEISLNVIEPSESFSQNYVKNATVRKNLSTEESESSNYSSDSSYDISKDKSARGRKPTAKTKKYKQSAKKGKVGAKTKSQKVVKYKKKTVLNVKQEASDSDSPDSPKKKKRGRPKKLVSERKVYRCDAEGCQYSTTISSNLKSHKVLHSDERPFKCDKCEKTYKMKAELNRHQNIHEGKRFECTFEGCNLNYSMLKQLQKHIKIIHTKEAPLLNCDWEGCRYSTYHSNCLKTHRKIHDGQRPHKCPYCEKAFNSPSNLWCHKLKHENKGGFKCDFEGCTYSTYRKAYLKNHKLTHYDERMYTCAWPGCGDSFKTGNGLASHKLMHENLRRHKCTWEGCDFASNLSTGLKSHVEQVHEKKKRNRIPKRALQNLMDSNLEFKGASSSQFAPNNTNHNNNNTNNNNIPKIINCFGTGLDININLNQS